jgi:hypothetical protein
MVYKWLAGGNKPDFRTINNFNFCNLKECFQDVFSETVGILVEEGWISPSFPATGRCGIGMGLIKQDRGLRRFMLRGIPKVNAERGLVALAHNIIKKQAKMA